MGHHQRGWFSAKLICVSKTSILLLKFNAISSQETRIDYFSYKTSLLVQKLTICVPCFVITLTNSYLRHTIFLMFFLGKTQCMTRNSVQLFPRKIPQQKRLTPLFHKKYMVHYFV